MVLENQKVLVWDPFVRVFHWSLVLSYLIAWVSAEEWASLHEQVGYFILVLLGLRVLWGVIGTQHARFRDFVYGRTVTMGYLRSLRAGTPRHYLGHNPAGGWMVIALLLSLAVAGVSGILIGDAEHGVWKEIHEGSANLTLLLVVVHVSGVVLASLMHGENLVRAMLTGHKMRRSEDV